MVLLIVLLLIIESACNCEQFVYPSWNTVVANLSINISAGLQPLSQQNTTIYNASLEDGTRNPNGTYNHGPIPIYWNNMFFVSWYNSPQNESQYMRSLISTSIDGITWSKPIEAFTNFTQHGQENENWFISPKTNNLYTACSLFDYNDIRTPIMRQVKLSNDNKIELGDIFWLNATKPVNSNDLTKYVNKTYLEMDNETISDIQIYIDSLLHDWVSNGGSSNTQQFNERSMYLIPNTTHYNNKNNSYTQQIMLLLRASGGDDHNLWAASCINSFKDMLITNDKLFSCRPGTDNVVINMVNILDGKAVNISNNGQNCEWSKPVKTNIVDMPSRTCLSALPDGRIYYLGNPIVNSRNVLVLAISNDGLQFTRAYAVRYDPPPRKYDGKAKTIGFQYPSAMWIENDLYVTYSVNKEDIQISKLKLSQL